MVTEIKLFEFPDLSFLDLWGGWMKSEVYKRKVDTRDELLACILDAAARIKKCEDRLRRRASYIHIRDMQIALKFAVGF